MKETINKVPGSRVPGSRVPGSRVPGSRVPGSFRDPSGYLFWHESKLLRTVHTSYQKHFEWLTSSGLYKKLTEQKLLIPHKGTALRPDVSQNLPNHTMEGRTFAIIQPELIPFISYPYEWSFSQLKDAALTTLAIQKTALEYGMQLKDASAYNIQFKDGKPIFIDTLSFELYDEGKPWIAYKQFCQHFLAPLALMAHTDIDLNKLFRIYIDGVPLHLASKLLPFKTHFKPSLKLHIHLHAKAQKKYEDTTDHKKTNRKVSKTAIKGLIDNLENTVKALSWKPEGTEWAEYYTDDSYNKVAFANKKEIIKSFLQEVQPETVWDLGGNDGTFSRLATVNASVVSFDIDPASIEKNYLHAKKHNETNILPLLLDLTNPSPGIGWHHQERSSLAERGPVDLVMGLALIHHLAISNNVPLSKIAHFFSKLGNNLIIEFVPKSDKKVKKLLATRADIFPEYTEKSFEEIFSDYFEIVRKEAITDSDRTLYLMKKGHDR